jgi:hypothetical protein
MIQLFFKCIRWLATLGVMLWFVVLPMMPVYGLLSPWPQAQQKLKEDGITGLALMSGASSQTERGFDSSGEYWRDEKQRSYVVVPDSFHRLEIFTYSELKGSGIAGVEKQVLRRQSLILLLAFWIFAALFTVWQVRRWSAKEQLLRIHE